MKTQIRLEYKVPGFLFSEEGDVEISEYSTNVALGSLPGYAFAFQIYKLQILEAKVEDGSTTEVRKRTDESGWYYPDGTVVPAEQLKDERILYSNLKSFNASYAVKTRQGNWQPFYPEKDKII
jgi:hypothetical protein